MPLSLRPFLAERGCLTPDIGLLQPADPFLDTAGEDLRRRIFITADQRGTSLCLRPEFTIPVCLHHLAERPGAVRYGYEGPVFRQRAEEAAEFAQAGIEDLGHDDLAKADRAILADCIGALKSLGLQHFDTVIGDQALFEAVLAGLGLPSAWQKRLRRAFGDTALMEADLHRLAANGTGRREFLAKLPAELADLVGDGNGDGVEAWVQTAFTEAGLSPHTGRTPREIASRLMDKAELASASLDAAHRAALDAFLQFEAPADRAIDQLSGLAGEHGLALDDVLQGLAQRLAHLPEITGAAAAATFRAGFGRRLDYYTGITFEMRVAGAAKPVAGGGRYDRLMSLLGAPEPVPAVGFSLWLDRIAAAVNGQGAS